jgi:hypothetical protein
MRLKAKKRRLFMNQTPTLNLACAPFVRDIVARYGKRDRYVADLVMLEATLRQPSAGRRTDLVAKYPLETLVIRNELATGRAITVAELTYVRQAAEWLDVKRLSMRSDRAPQSFIGLPR